MSVPRFSEEVILSVADNVHDIAMRFQPVLSVYGITPEFLEHFVGKIKAAEKLSGEGTKRVELRWLNRNTNQELDSCYQWGVRLRNRLQMCFGTDSVEFGEFPIERLMAARYNVRLMKPVMETLINLASKYQNELAEFGFTPSEHILGGALLDSLVSIEKIHQDTAVKEIAGSGERYAVFQSIYDDINRILEAGRYVFHGNMVMEAYFQSPWPKYYIVEEGHMDEAEPVGWEISLVLEKTGILTDTFAGSGKKTGR